MSMQFPVMTRELARRIQLVINALQVGGMIYLQQQPGNPYGIEIKQFGCLKKPEQHGASRAAHRIYDDHLGG